MSKINKKLHLVNNLFDRKNIEQVPTRNGYGEGLVIAGDKDKNVVALCADLVESTRTHLFMKKYPDRYIEMGVAEQNLATVASGMAAVGKVPFISSYGMFSPGRNWEQIRTTICYNQQNVKIIGAHTGISVGPDGGTHQAVEDMAIMRVIPNMIVLAPCDVHETRKATIAAAKVKSPVYLRFGREKTPVMTTNKTPFKIGKAETFIYGKDVSIIACGTLMYEAVYAAHELRKSGIDAEVINSHTIKPLDGKSIYSSARKTGAVVTVEEHQAASGLGGAVSEFLSSIYPVPIKRVGVNNRFGESGQQEELLKEFKLTTPFIVKAAKEAVKMKGRRK